MTTPQYLIAALIAALLLGRPVPTQAQSASYAAGIASALMNIA